MENHLSGSQDPRGQGCERTQPGKRPEGGELQLSSERAQVLSDTGFDSSLCHLALQCGGG